jgi:hypothetical protein
MPQISPAFGPRAEGLTGAKVPRVHFGAFSREINAPRFREKNRPNLKPPITDDWNCWLCCNGL